MLPVTRTPGQPGFNVFAPLAGQRAAAGNCKAAAKELIRVAPPYRIEGASNTRTPIECLRRFPKSALSCLREAVPPLARRVTGAMKVSGWLRELDR